MFLSVPAANSPPKTRPKAPLRVVSNVSSYSWERVDGPSGGGIFHLVCVHFWPGRSSFPRPRPVDPCGDPDRRRRRRSGCGGRRRRSGSGWRRRPAPRSANGSTANGCGRPSPGPRCLVHLIHTPSHHHFPRPPLSLPLGGGGQKRRFTLGILVS